MWIDDQVIEQCEHQHTLKIWIPETFKVVLGSGNKVDTEVIEASCKKNGIPVLKRYGGGGTVLLHPKCVIVSYGTWVKSPFNNSVYFRLINEAVIDALANKWPIFSDLSHAGISDIAYKDKKICGTSMFRSRNYLLYQASILIETNIEEIETYLSHPSKEPDYRKGKSHRDFLTSLNEIDSSAQVSFVKEQLESQLQKELNKKLIDELEIPLKKHIPYLLKRAKVGRETDANNLRNK